MLKTFSVENFSSFKQKVTLDLTSGKTEILSNHTCSFDKYKINKGAVIYGANASGKSNLISALEYSKKIISGKINDLDTYKKYFRLNDENRNLPSTFEYYIRINEKLYAYGFSIFFQDDTIEEEWLYEIKKPKSEMIFERSKNNITLGKHLNGDRFLVYKEDMVNQSDKLFLTEIGAKKIELAESNLINDIYYWFTTKLVIIFPQTEFMKTKITTDNNLLSLFKKYLNSFDTGISDIVKNEDSFESVSRVLPIEVKIEIEKQLKLDNINSINFSGHDGTLYKFKRNEDDNIIVSKIGLIHECFKDEVFELKDESDGTIRLFDLIPLIRYFEEDYTIVIDEFERSLHPLLTQTYLKIFYAIADSCAQLILSTHESTLLDLKLLRRDEIWFVEKNKQGESQLFSLGQFKERYDKKVDKSYLLGRYGGIPVFDDFQIFSDNKE